MIADFLLVQKIRNGDNQAGNQLVEKYYSSIYQYCYLHTHISWIDLSYLYR